MKYLFDTDVISVLMKRKVSKSFLARLESIPYEDQGISALTVFEIYYGAHKSPNPQRFIQLFESLILPQILVLPFDDTAARIAAKVRIELEKKRITVPPADLQIAAIALATGRVLVTGNVKHFVPIPGLDVQNWLED